MTEIKKSAWGRMRSGGNTRTLLLLSFGGGFC